MSREANVNGLVYVTEYAMENGVKKIVGVKQVPTHTRNHDDGYQTSAQLQERAMFGDKTAKGVLARRNHYDGGQ